LAEQAADQQVSDEELDAASGEAEEAYEDSLLDEGDTVEDAEESARLSAAHAASYASNPALDGLNIVEVMQAAAEASPAGATEESTKQAEILRDLFGNPFRPVSVKSAWLAWDGGTVPRLAQSIYDDRAFDRLPALADALEEAGCTDSDILGHCRGPGPHVKGCWVVDLILGKD
jgi:hypothetical protein